MRRWRESAVDWLILHTPSAVLLNPERVAIKVAVGISGLVAMLVVHPGTLSALLPHWVILLWGVMWFLGGLFGLIGYVGSHRPLEMAGHRLIILGSVIYAVAILTVAGPRALTAVILIAVIAACSAVRLLIAAGSRLVRRRRQ